MKGSHFLRHICLAYNRAEERSAAHDELKSQINKVQEVALQKVASRKAVENEIGELRGRITDVIEKESRTVRHVYDDEQILASLKKRLGQLEKKLDAFVMLSNLYSRRTREIDERIREKMRPKHYVLLKSQLRRLEDRYRALSGKRVDREKLNQLKERINELRQRLEL